MGAFRLLMVAAAAAALPPSTVYVMRHCSRSTYLPDLEHQPVYQYLANYSDGGELPDWGVAPQLCTARGRKIVRGEGAALKETFAGYGTVVAFHDSGSKRDATTAADFLEGLGLGIASAPSADIFNPVRAGYCAPLAPADRARALADQLVAVAPPPRLEERVAALQSALGVGVAPRIETIPDVVNATTGGWGGGTAIASEWIECLLLQSGAGLPPGYGRFTNESVYAMTDIHQYAFAVKARGLPLARRYGSNLAAHVVAGLAEANAGNAAVFVGHDTNLEQLGALLNLTWALPPYADNLAPPGSILRLTASDSPTGRVVEADLLYTTFESDDGALRRSSVAFSHDSTGLPLAEFAARANATFEAACVRL